MLFSQEGEDRSERSLGSATARDTGPLTHTAVDRALQKGSPFMALLSPKRQGSVRTRPGFVTCPEHSSSPWPRASASLLYLHTLHTYIDKLHTQWKHCKHKPAHHNTSDVHSQIQQIYKRTTCIYTHPTHKSTHHIHASYVYIVTSHRLYIHPLDYTGA